MDKVIVWLLLFYLLLLHYYRPISVLPIVARLFEKNIHSQLSDYIKGRIYKYQSGFRPKRSPETAFLNASNRLFLNIDQGKS